MIENKLPEILAPCGSYETLVAAIKAGADACYIGGSRFGARAFAKNLDYNSIEKAIDFAHLKGTKLYLTVNTLFKDNEISELCDFLLPYYEAGLDAAIVQDLGAFSLIKKAFPDLKLHCSTQMNITSVHAAKAMKDYGATRIVTAREMSLEEIRYIKDQVDIEIETFVHGAMCYSYSGRCLMSSYIGGRSGNRGRCAQPCRKCYDDSYVLSMKDLCSIENIPKLIEAGIDSLKIEGRMKNEYYVASAVDAYKTMCIDYSNNDFNPEKAKRYKTKLANIYNRGGFCDGYFFMHNGPQMISTTRPNNQGILIGNLEKIESGKVFIKLREDLYRGDVLEISLKNGEIIEITSGIDAFAGQTVSLNAPKTKLIKNGQKIYRTRCNYLIDNIEKTLLNKKSNIPVRFKLTAKIGSPLNLTCFICLNGKEYEATIQDAIVEKSQNRPCDAENIRAKLAQLGNTDYTCNNIEIIADEDSFVPVGLLKKMRRDVIALAENVILNESRRREFSNIMSSNAAVDNIAVDNVAVDNIVIDNAAVDNIAADEKYSPSLRVSVTTLDQISAIIDNKDIEIDILYLEKNLYYQADKCGHIKALCDRGIDIYIKLPYVIRNTFDINSYLKDMNYSGIYINCIDGFMAYIKERDNLKGKKIVLGYSLYAYNKHALGFWESFLNGFSDDFILENPAELTLDEFEKLTKGNICKYEYNIYGYAEMMLSAQCVNKTLHTKDSYLKNKDGILKITDDKGNSFYSRSICGECVNVIYNGVALCLFAKINKILDIGIENIRMNFTIEDKEKTKQILSLISEYQRTNVLRAPNGDYTNGHTFRGVE